MIHNEMASESLITLRMVFIVFTILCIYFFADQSASNQVATEWNSSLAAAAASSAQNSCLQTAQNSNGGVSGSLDYQCLNGCTYVVESSWFGTPKVNAYGTPNPKGAPGVEYYQALFGKPIGPVPCNQSVGATAMANFNDLNTSALGLRQGDVSSQLPTSLGGSPSSYDPNGAFNLNPTQFLNSSPSAPKSGSSGATQSPASTQSMSSSDSNPETPASDDSNTTTKAPEGTTDSQDQAFQAGVKNVPFGSFDDPNQLTTDKNGNMIYCSGPRLADSSNCGYLSLNAGNIGQPQTYQPPLTPAVQQPPSTMAGTVENPATPPDNDTHAPAPQTAGVAPNQGTPGAPTVGQTKAPALPPTVQTIIPSSDSAIPQFESGLKLGSNPLDNLVLQTEEIVYCTWYYPGGGCPSVLQNK